MKEKECEKLHLVSFFGGIVCSLVIIPVYIAIYSVFGLCDGIHKSYLIIKGEDIGSYRPLTDFMKDKKQISNKTIVARHEKKDNW